MKFGSRCSEAFLSGLGFRALDQFAGPPTGRLLPDFSRDIPISNIFAIAQRGASKSQPDTIISKTKIFCRFSHAIWRQPFGKACIIPISAEHEWRTHHYSAASIEPLLLLA